MSKIADIQYNSDNLTLHFSNGKKQSIPFDKIKSIVRAYGKAKQTRSSGFWRFLASIFAFIVDWQTAFDSREKVLRGIKVELGNGNTNNYPIIEKKNKGLIIKINKLCNEKGWD